MGRKVGTIKWEKATQIRQNHNIISSDFPKYVPQPWKFMDGQPRMELLMSNEYQRMWIQERDAWNKRMYPENNAQEDIVKRYVLTFKTNHQPPKPEKKKPFRLKKYDNITSITKNRRPPGDKAMAFEKKETPESKPTKKPENEGS